LAECRKELSSLKTKEQQGLFGQFSAIQGLCEAEKKFVADAGKGNENSKGLIQCYIVSIIKKNIIGTIWSANAK